MAARIDFDYLRSLAAGPEDRAVLNRIERDRETLLSGGSLEAPGSHLELSLVLTPELIDSEPPKRLRLALRSDLAPASMDTFLEIFRDRAHALLPGFDSVSSGTVVDLGANEGYYTLRMKMLNPGLRVVAAEPVRENAELFRANLEANEISGVEIRETAVTDRLGSVALETLPHVGTVASTDIFAFPRPWIRSEMTESRIVPTTTLPALLEDTGVEEAEILKIDVEGSEVEILSSSREQLRRFKRIVVECHGAEARHSVREIVESQSFSCIHEEDKRSGDLYFLRR